MMHLFVEAILQLLLQMFQSQCQHQRLHQYHRHCHLQRLQHYKIKKCSSTLDIGLSCTPL